MVNVDGIAWLLIVTTVMCNHWREINCTWSNSDDDTSTSDTDSESSSMSSHEYYRRMERTKHRSNKKRIVYPLSNENVNDVESEQQGIAIHHDDLDHYNVTNHSITIHQNVTNVPMKFDSNADNNKTHKKRKYRIEEYDTIQYTSDFKPISNGTIHFKAEHSEKIHDMDVYTTNVINKENTKREETLNNSKIIFALSNKKRHGHTQVFKKVHYSSKLHSSRYKELSETFTEKIKKSHNTTVSYYKMESNAVRYSDITQYHGGNIIRYKARQENEIIHDKHLESVMTTDETTFPKDVINWTLTTKSGNVKNLNGHTRVFKKGYRPSEHHFRNVTNPRSYSLIKLIVEKITKRNEAAKSSNQMETTTKLSLKEFLSIHGLRATELTSKKDHQYDHKIYGTTQRNIVKPNFAEHELIEREPLRAKLRNKMNLLRSTRISVPEVQGLQEKPDSEEKIPSSPTQLSTTTISTSMINTDLMEDLSPYAIEKQMRRVVLKCKEYMNITIEVLDRTVEYNDIVLLKITKADKNDAYLRAKQIKYADEVEQKKIIFIVHGLSVMGMKYLISNEEVFYKLLTYYTDHLDKFDIFLIPMANPDGYAATCNSQARMYWNKNMSPQSDCPGVALDRNFNVEWDNTQKISSCSAMYPGPAPFSEAETRAVQKVFHLYGHRIAGYIHVHASSFDQKVFKGDAVLYPRGYTEIQSDDDKYIDLKGEIDEAMKNSSFRVVSVTTDTLFNWYGKVTGTSVDYASTVYGIPYALEFAMQVYKGIQLHALETIWKRVIDVVFNNIWKNSQRNTDY